MQKQY